MTRPDAHSELMDLVASVANGTITPAQHERLQQILAADPDARRLYFDYLDLHLTLGQVHAAGRVPQARRRPTRWIAVAAAASLIFAALLYLTTHGAHTVPVAVLVQSASARFYGAGEFLRVGSEIAPLREYPLKTGRAELKFRNGVTAIVEGPAVFEVRDEMRLRVSYGKCSVHVAPGAEGFAVETPLRKIADRGNRFTVDVDEVGETDVQVGESREMPDRVVRYTTTPRKGSTGAELLTGVTVRRGGREITYALPDLIGIELLHFKNMLKNGKFIATVTDGPDPAASGGSRTALLEDDANINTGVINPGGSVTPLTTDPVMNDPEDPKRPNTPGMAVRFRKPVINDSGPDIVLFDFQPVIQPEYGDPFHVSPLHFTNGLRSHTVTRFDLGTFSPEAQIIAGFRLNLFERPVRCLSDLRTVPFRGTNFTVTSKLLAVGIDLSDLGYPPGAAVDAIFIQDVLDDGNQVDPVFIAGLPPLVKP